MESHPQNPEFRNNPENMYVLGAQKNHLLSTKKICFDQDFSFNLS